MYIHVKLLNGYSGLLTYKIPFDWDTTNLVGTIVQVPLQKRLEFALVQSIMSELPKKVTYTIRNAHAYELLPHDKIYLDFLRQLSNYYAIDTMHFYQKVHTFLKQKENEEPLADSLLTCENSMAILTKEQQHIVDSLEPLLEQPKYSPILLHGVTGSGKTEIYKKLLLRTYNQGKSTLLLVPEVTLAVQFFHILKKQLPDIEFYNFHSATGVKEKKGLWSRLQTNKPLVIIGVHLPIMLPLSNLGLIIVDEEHDIGYQEKKHPKVNTKEAALLRANLYKIPIILGSATPSLTSLYNVKHKNWLHFELKKRFAGAFATIKVVKLNDKQSKARRSNFWFSKELEQAIKERLMRKEQTILFLNRRGYSFFLQCKMCGHIPQCPQCSVSLTVHSNNKLLCHYCSYSLAITPLCTICKAPESSFLKKGIGTQQIISIIEKMFPQAKVARADLDATINKKNWHQTMKEFEEGTIDILVGTQTITKGYHFPRVTLVGILWADINLNIPFYNASETTLHQLIQVAGRAGRQSAESLVIVQTMIDHPLYGFLQEIDYTKFYDHEIQHRQELLYPPCSRFAEIELKHEDEQVVIEESKIICSFLTDIIEKYKLEVLILGPAQPPVHKIKNVFARKIYLKSSSMKILITLFNKIDKDLFQSSLFFTPNPLN